MFLLPDTPEDRAALEAIRADLRADPEKARALFDLAVQIAKDHTRQMTEPSRKARKTTR